MIHHRQRLPLLFEARDDLARVHAELDDFQRHAPPHRLLLLGHPHRAEAALADLLEQFVRPDALARFLGLQPRELLRDLRTLGIGLQKIPRRLMRREQCADFASERIVAGTVLGKRVLASLARRLLEHRLEDCLRAWRGR